MPEIDEFTEEPQDDPLQIAGDVALDAIRGALRGYGIAGEDYSVVITLHHDENAATVLHLPGTDEREHSIVALETQLVHAMASAKALGFTLHIVDA
jgi:hypothetical protein